MLPHRSGVHEASSPTWKKSELDPEPDCVPERTPVVDVEMPLVPGEPVASPEPVVALPPPERV